LMISISRDAQEDPSARAIAENCREALAARFQAVSCS
jgi:hypothetical protein